MIKLLPAIYFVHATSFVLFAEAEPTSFPGGPQTAFAAIVGGATVMLGTLVWIVKKQFEDNKEQRIAFLKALDDIHKEMRDGAD